jgi:coenzyme Q-binding protein COQ10
LPSFRSAQRVRHSAQEMFDLVADVERYPEFVPLCQSLQIKRRSTNSDGVEVLFADMQVGYKAIRERFTSKVTLDREHKKILVEYVDGPFSRMQNVWSFVDDGENAAQVEFFIDYEFRSRMLGALMGSMFDVAFRKFSSAFEARADKVFRPAGA